MNWTGPVTAHTLDYVEAQLAVALSALQQLRHHAPTNPDAAALIPVWRELHDQALERCRAAWLVWLREGDARPGTWWRGVRA